MFWRLPQQPLVLKLVFYLFPSRILYVMYLYMHWGCILPMIPSCCSRTCCGCNKLFLILDLCLSFLMTSLSKWSTLQVYSGTCWLAPEALLRQNPRSDVFTVAVSCKETVCCSKGETFSHFSCLNKAAGYWGSAVMDDKPGGQFQTWEPQWSRDGDKERWK